MRILYLINFAGKAGTEKYIYNLVTRFNKTETECFFAFNCRDLTRRALDGELDPVFCRDAELDRMVEILCRRQKNNPCLVGEPGVGKTALAEGLAQRIAKGQVPRALQGRRLLALDMASLVAGTKYRGDFEERFKNLLEELVRDGTV